jgi:hypothetical protein
MVTVAERDRRAEAAGSSTRTRVRVQRRGTLVAPVDVAVLVEGEDEPRRFSWDGRAPWHEIVLDLEDEAKVVAVDVDPDLALPLDADRVNNHWRGEPSALPSWSWAARVLTLLQSAMLGARTLS